MQVEQGSKIGKKIEKKMKKTLCVYIDPFLGANTEPKNGDWKQFEEGFPQFSLWAFFQFSPQNETFQEDRKTKINSVSLG